MSPIEIESLETDKHGYLNVFMKKFSKSVDKIYIISQKDIGRKNELHFMPVYMTPFIC